MRPAHVGVVVDVDDVMSRLLRVRVRMFDV